MCYILEAQRFDRDGHEFHHVGYMNTVFKTKQVACNYYDRYNPHMRSLNAHGTWLALAKRLGPK